LFDAKAVIVQLDHWQEQVTYRRDDDYKEKNLEDTENFCLLGAQQKFTILTQSDKKKLAAMDNFLVLIGLIQRL
jgi:hypothetical protein